MRWYYDLKIGAKLILGFIVVAIIAAIVGVVGIVNLNQIAAEDKLLYEENTLGMEAAGKIAEFFQRIRYNSMKALVVDEGGERDLAIRNIQDYSQEIDLLLERRQEGIVTEEDQKILDDLLGHWGEYKRQTGNYIALIQQGLETQARDLILTTLAEAGNAVRAETDSASDFNSRSAQEKADNNSALAATSTIILLAVVVIGVVIAVVLGIVISRIISNPLKQMAEAADKLAVGNVEADVDVTTKDEIGSLAQSFRRMIANTQAQARAAEQIASGDLTVEIEVMGKDDLLGNKLAEIVEKNNEIMVNVVASSDQVAAGAKQVSDSSMALSQGAAEQASSIQELTASIEEIAAQTRDNADNANQANELAERAKTDAAQGNTQMQDMLRAMEEINVASANISNIIKVIDEIAFQTNILALNAAVEAARAGQHGKGFAVVAEEVRNLAARSADAARETTDLIEGSIKKTEGGTKIAEETAEALDGIVQGIDQVANLVNGIAVASNEQAAGVEQINQGVMQISHVVQSNSATSEQGAAASQQLSGQAAFLKEMVGQFRLKTLDHSNRGLQTLSPEVLKMLEDMGAAKKGEAGLGQESERAPAKPKIALSDQEFGKY